MAKLPEDVERCDLFRARVRIRRALPVKPEAEVLDGTEVEVSAGWPIEDDETRGGLYAGEWAMILPLGAPVGWIASGDLEFLP